MADKTTYRRVVVALDSSRESRSALDASAGLAAALGAELAGVFIEDVNQLRLGALPFARLIGPGAMSREVDLQSIERSMRRAAADARTALEHLAATRDRPVPWSFRVVRGAVAHELGAAAEPADLIVVEERALGRVARAALASAKASVLCLCSAPAGANEVIVSYGETEADQRALDAAARVARATKRTLTVLIDDDEQQPKLRDAIGGDNLSVQSVRVSDRSRDFARAVAERPGAIVVRSGVEDDKQAREALEALLESGRYSVLVAR